MNRIKKKKKKKKKKKGRSAFSFKSKKKKKKNTKWTNYIRGKKFFYYTNSFAHKKAATFKILFNYIDEEKLLKDFIFSLTTNRKDKSFKT